MVGSVYLPSVTGVFLAQPPIYLMTGREAPMQLAAEATHFRRLCDVHLKPAGGVVFVARSARASQAESAAATFHSAEGYKAETLQIAAGRGRSK
jgi:hypothetical protein